MAELFKSSTNTRRFENRTNRGVGGEGRGERERVSIAAIGLFGCEELYKKQIRLGIISINSSALKIYNAN